MRASSVYRRAVAAAAASVFLLVLVAGTSASPIGPGPEPPGPPAIPSLVPISTLKPGPLLTTSFAVRRSCIVCPITVTAGASQSFTVTASNIILGTPWAGYAQSVSFSSSDPQAVLPASYTFTAADAGVHVFAVTLKTTGQQTVTVFQTSLTAMKGTSDPVTIVPAAAHHTAFTVQPGDATVGGPLATQPVVEVRDQYENRTASAAAVTLSLVPPAGSAGAALMCLGPGTTVPAVVGTAVYIGCAVSMAGIGYTLVATSSGLLSGASAAFSVFAVITSPAPLPSPTPSSTPSPTPSQTPAPTPGPVGTLLMTAASPYMNNNAIDWSRYVDLTTTAPAGTGYQIQVTTDQANWTTLADAHAVPLTFTIGSSGSYTYRYTPIRNYWYRSVAGSTKTDGALRVTVRQTIAIRPQVSGTGSVSAGSSITFAATVRPARPELAKAGVLFQLYLKSGGSWVLSKSATVVIDDSGIAQYTFAFPSGSWYVRAQAQPTPVNANSFWTPNQYYTAG